MPESVAAHPLLAPLGISALPVAPCRLDCPLALEAAEQWLEVAAGQGYAAEAGWLRECFSWAISWSELHGVTEVKTPLFKMCLETGSALRTRTIRRAGTSAVEGSAAGLSFPYAAPAPQPHMIQIGLASYCPLRMLPGPTIGFRRVPARAKVGRPQKTTVCPTK